MEEPPATGIQYSRSTSPSHLQCNAVQKHPRSISVLLLLSLTKCFSMSPPSTTVSATSTMPSKLASCVIGIDVGGTNTDRLEFLSIYLGHFLTDFQCDLTE